MINILIVDDEVNLCASMKLLLEIEISEIFGIDEKRLNIEVAYSGNEALEIIKNSQFDLLISDMRMPNGTGRDILEYLYMNKCELPVLILVTGESEISREEAITLGAKDLLMKPLDFDIFLRLVRQVIQGRIDAS